MNSNTSLKLAYFLPLIGILSVMAGCPEPSAEEHEKRLIERSESQISDNQSVLSEKLCESHDNKKHIYRSNHDFAEKWLDCSITTGWVPPAARLQTDCMKSTFTSMSDQCLNCFDQMTACTASNCWKKCMNDSRGRECQDCASEHCGDAMYQCSGISAIEIPDFQRD